MAIGSAAASTGLGIYQVINSSIQAKKAKEEIENFQRQDLQNPYANIQLNTVAADNQTDANLSRNATSIDALQRGGTRAVIGALPKINDSNILLQGLIAEDFAKQDIARQYSIAEGDKLITQIRENREIGALDGLGQQLQTARQDAMSGFSNLVSSGLAIGSALDGGSALTDSGAYANAFKSKPIDLSVKIPNMNVSGAYGKKSPFF